MIECTAYLYCRVAEWSYHRDVFLNKKMDDFRMLSLTGETEHQGLVEKGPYDIRVVAGPLDADETDGNVLSIIEAMPEYNFPELLTALIPVSVEQFDDLRDCLSYASRVIDSKVIACLAIETFKVSGGKNHETCYVESRQWPIVDIAWKLSVGCEQ